MSIKDKYKLYREHHKLERGYKLKKFMFKSKSTFKIRITSHNKELDSKCHYSYDIKFNIRTYIAKFPGSNSHSTQKRPPSMKWAGTFSSRGVAWSRVLLLHTAPRLLVCPWQSHGKVQGTQDKSLLNPGVGYGGTTCNPSTWGGGGEVDQEFKIICSYTENLQQLGKWNPVSPQDKRKIYFRITLISRNLIKIPNECRVYFAALSPSLCINRRNQSPVSI